MLSLVGVVTAVTSANVGLETEEFASLSKSLLSAYSDSSPQFDVKKQRTMMRIKAGFFTAGPDIKKRVRYQKDTEYL